MSTISAKPPDRDASREEHRIYASVCGYHWGACPVCGEEFGAHEIRHIQDAGAIRQGKYHVGYSVCPKKSCQFWGKISWSRYTRSVG